MKYTLIIVAFFACALDARAQGTLQFLATLSATNVVPPNGDPTLTTATFSLTGVSLSFRVEVPAETFIARNAYIQGPAFVGINGPVIFDLGGAFFRGGIPELGVPPVYVFRSPYAPPFGAGPFNLTDSQINELMSGLWYVNVTSTDLPNGKIRGQILLVPEPSVAALLGLAILVVFFRRFEPLHRRS